jgi:hypothetical protein
MKDEKDNQTKEVENVEIEPLTDEDLEAVGGGNALQEIDGCSCTQTTGNCTG